MRGLRDQRLHRSGMARSGRRDGANERDHRIRPAAGGPARVLAHVGCRALCVRTTWFRAVSPLYGKASVTKKRTGEPWISAADFGRLLPPFSVNLLVRDIETSLRFYREVLDAFVHYADVDFGALKIGGAEVQLHADHAYDAHPWYPRLADGEARGLGAELRLLGLDPDRVEKRARESGAAIVRAATTKGHGWREVAVEDPDGYVWAVGV